MVYNQKRISRRFHIKWDKCINNLQFDNSLSVAQNKYHQYEFLSILSFFINICIVSLLKKRSSVRFVKSSVWLKGQGSIWGQFHRFLRMISKWYNTALQNTFFFMLSLSNVAYCISKLIWANRMTLIHIFLFFFSFWWQKWWKLFLGG